MKKRLVFALSAALFAQAQEKRVEPLGCGEHRPPEELFEIERVVDSDTLHVRRHGKIEKLRLLSVDTEERLTGRAPFSSTKPETVFGEECALWAESFFEGQAGGSEGAARVGLRFPDDREERDPFGRLLCHVILPDGTDFNLLLVREGKSPYFNKYGNSELCHETFVAAQRVAQSELRGIWNPSTNTARTADAPSAKRPYDRLLPWWQARAEAVEAFEARRAADPERWIDGSDPDSLERAARTGLEVEVFGEIERLFDEDSGDWTLLLRAQESNHPLRVRIARADRDLFAGLDLASITDEFRQNYLYVRGRVRTDPRGYELWARGSGAIRTADPALPADR
jgi:endonuclease YncB( thermonuclease family)